MTIVAEPSEHSGDGIGHGGDLDPLHLERAGFRARSIKQGGSAIAATEDLRGVFVYE